MIERHAAPLRQQAVQHIRARIVAGEYEPGSRLTEKALCAEYTVSRTVIREALRQLESEQLIEMRPNVGPVVRLLTVTDIAHLYEVRAALEALAGGRAARNATPEDIAALRSTIDQLAVHGGDLGSTLAIKDAFYAKLLQIAGNPIAGEMLTNIQARISAMRSITLTVPGRLKESVAELSQIVDAIAAGDEALSAALCGEHVRRAHATAEAAVAERERDPATHDRTGETSRS